MSAGKRTVRADVRRALEGLLGQGRQRSAAESAELGQSLRRVVPRDAFASWWPPDDRVDPVELLLAQDAPRVPELVGIRHERMARTPFTFYRGGAALMTSDLAALQTTGIDVQACGDAHIANFGLFLSPERRTVFDINDFDETMRGPWEWDVARLAVSVEVCARDRGMGAKQRRRAVLECVAAYREAMRGFAKMGGLDVWYAHLDVDAALAELGRDLTKSQRKRARKALGKSKAKNSLRAVSRFTEVVDGQLRVVSDPPLVVPLRDLVESKSGLAVPADLDMAKVVAAVLARYALSLSPERRNLVARYRGVDIAHKVVGVGSVGLRAWIVVLEGATPDDALVLQVKEARPAAWEAYLGKAPQPTCGQRVVEGQRAIQVASDVLLGWTRLPDARGHLRDYYVRQLWDGKGSIDLDAIEPKQLRQLARACGWTLARAHARTGDRVAIASYLGKADIFDQALLAFAVAYADQNERDHAAFVEAIAAPSGAAAPQPA